MPKFTTRRPVPFTPEQMFAIVADVESYPEFLPLCESLVVESREDGSDGQASLIATMGVGYKGIREAFTTRVALRPREPAILVEYLDGPFHHLENRWRFLPHAQGSEIDFFIDYEFRSKMLAVLMGSLFDQAFRKFTEAFDSRARKVYGNRT
ncbi:MAG: type II toxin-antitoxin system RatA family toxin [Hyphomicrobium sp.]